MSIILVSSLPLPCSSTVIPSLYNSTPSNPSLFSTSARFCLRLPLFSRHFRVPTAAKPSAMEAVSTEHSGAADNQSDSPLMKLLFVEMGVGYDQHGQNITSAAMRACRDAISSNSIPAFRRGSIPGVSFDQMKLQIKLGVPHPLQQSLDIEKVKSVFP
ncbi:hypothetical protein CsatB_001088 [Cannabis sativa]